MAREQPHLGLAYLAAYLEKNDISVSILDADIEQLNELQTADEVVKLNPKVVGITGTTEDRFMATSIVTEIRKRMPDILLIAGGPHYSYSSSDALLQVPSLDAIILGEGEETVVELVNQYKKSAGKNRFAHIKGITYRDRDGLIHTTESRPLLTDLNSLPAPAWHLFNMEKYQGIMSANVKQRTIGIISSRGCPYKCSFCANSRTNKVRYLSPIKFVDQIEHLVTKYGFTSFNFQDDSFTAKPDHARAICNEIQKRGLQISWYCSMRINSAARDIDLLKTMKDAGCIAMGFGVEFASDHVLKRIRKGTTVKNMELAIRNIVKTDISHINIFLINSLPGQTSLNTIRSMFRIRKFKRLLGHRVHSNSLHGGWTTIYPGTHLEQIAQKQDLLPKDFSWNAPYENTAQQHLGPTTKFVPLFESKTFPINKIQKTVKRAYLLTKALDALQDASPTELLKKILHPGNWIRLFKAITGL